MTEPETIAALSDQQVVALTLWGEARSERIEGRIAIACVLRNRVTTQRRAFGWTLRGACLKPWQFSCWLDAGGRANHALVMDAARGLIVERPLPVRLRECLWIADGLIRDQFQDTVRGATHYYSPAGMVPRDRVPEWARGRVPVVVVGHHRFYAGIA